MLCYATYVATLRRPSALARYILLARKYVRIALAQGSTAGTILAGMARTTILICRSLVVAMLRTIPLFGCCIYRFHI